ncbi:aldo/keto reductase [Tessaracoccus defluvii]|uniref:Aldo/keto reductase n=1 Tax=Tessaracoccus defluvii TaxID=1285901 RepID=A0A7H0H710_9ACTN|nr:aldo/keto reductase [Tessaracoccus defluvii]QNP56326.1 aldo/keto reductase [Tessaracoccus defluvii]
MANDLPLNDATTLPALGFGLYKVEPEQAADVVVAGVEAGYRLVDGAEFYHNEAEVGEGLRRVDRSSLLVTSKFWGEEEMSRDAALRAFDASERNLGTAIDIYMIHWPRPARDRYVEVWRALIELRDAGRVRTIGVSNFAEHHLTRIIDETGVVPAINQVESHPWLPQHDLRAFHAAHGIVTQAWSPLGRGRLLADPAIGTIAGRLGVTPAQVIIRWHLELGGGLLPKSTNPGRLRSNLDVDGFRLSVDDMAALAALETGERTGTHPDERN